MSSERKIMSEQERLIRMQEQENVRLAQQKNENVLLSRHAADADDAEKSHPSEVPEELVQALERRVRAQRSESLYEMVCSFMYRLRKYHVSDEKIQRLQKNACGKPLSLDQKLDTTRFYKAADISASVWSDLRKSVAVPNENTIFKLMLALELNEEDAVCLMHKAGMEFISGDHKHDLVRRLLEITKNGFDIAVVQEEFDAAQKKCTSMESYVDSLYDDAAARKEKRSCREKELRSEAEEAGILPDQQDRKRKTVAQSVEERYKKICIEANALGKNPDEKAIKKIIHDLDYESIRISQRQNDLKDRFNELKDKYAAELNETKRKYAQEIEMLKTVGAQISESLMKWKEKLNQFA